MCGIFRLLFEFELLPPFLIIFFVVQTRWPSPFISPQVAMWCRNLKLLKLQRVVPWHSTVHEGRVALDVFVSEKSQRFFSRQKNSMHLLGLLGFVMSQLQLPGCTWKFLCRELQVNRGITLASWRWYNPSSHVPLWECFGNCWM